MLALGEDVGALGEPGERVAAAEGQAKPAGVRGRPSDVGAAQAVQHFGHPSPEEAVVEVSLDGPRMEDQFLPLAVTLGSPQRFVLRDLPLMAVHFGNAMLFGVRPLPPVMGWDQA